MNFRKTLFKIILSLIFLYGLYLLWAVMAFGGGCKKMNPETHILPNGYTGKVYIFFNQNEGDEVEYENYDTRIYRIPRSGILRTQFKPNSGWVDAEKYLNFYYEYNDSMILLNKLISGENSLVDLDSNSILVFEYGIVRGEVFGQGKINMTTYIVDSLKNFYKRDYDLTKEEFENWNK